MKISKFILPFLLFTLFSSTTFATTSYEWKELKETSYSARKLGLKTKEEIQGVGRFLKNTLGNEAGAINKVDNLLTQAGGKNLKAYSHAAKEFSESGVKLSKNADEFLSNQVLHGDQILGKGTNFAKDDLARVGQKYEDLVSKMDDVLPGTVDSKVWRASPSKYYNGNGATDDITEQVFKTHPNTTALS